MYPAPTTSDCQIATFRHQEMMATGLREQFVASVLSPAAAATASTGALVQRLAKTFVTACCQLRCADARLGRSFAAPDAQERGLAA